MERFGAGEGLDQHRGFLWSISYRMLGCAADAEDVVQETFVRALESPPPSTDEPWRPWLTRVAMNLSRDRLRARRRARYVGPWLPSPIEHDPLGQEGARSISGSAVPSGPAGESWITGGGAAERDTASAATRYDLRESVSFAFLLALEALSPNQRAVLLMRDVLDASIEETAVALDVSVANVKVLHHRARKRLESYDRTRERPHPDSATRDQEALSRFMSCVATGDLEGLQAMLTADARLLSDGGGEFHAARVPVVGAAKVARFAINIRSLWPEDTRYEIREINGEAALVGATDQSRSGYPTRLVLRLERDDTGLVREIHAVLATHKLTALSYR